MINSLLPSLYPIYYLTPCFFFYTIIYYFPYVLYLWCVFNLFKRLNEHSYHLFSLEGSRKTCVCFLTGKKRERAQRGLCFPGGWNSWVSNFFQLADKKQTQNLGQGIWRLEGRMRLASVVPYRFPRYHLVHTQGVEIGSSNQMLVFQFYFVYCFESKKPPNIKLWKCLITISTSLY